MLNLARQLVWVSLLSSSVAFGTPLSKHVEVRETEGLRAKLTVENYRVDLPQGPSFGTKTHLAYETPDLDSLEDIVVVQFIRGCQFEATRRDGKITIQHRIERELFGSIVPLVHPEWIVDSTDVDPVYNSASDRGRPRHYYYRWNSVPDSFNKATQHYYGEAKPMRPSLYVRDMPGTAFLMRTADWESAKNISLEFRSCLYRAKDIPLVSTPENLLESVTPLLCFNWNSSFIYDFDRGRFTSPKGLSPNCRTR